MSMGYWLALAGLVIVVALAVYAGYLWRQVWQRQQQRARLDQERDQRLATDIRFIAESMANDQAPMIEGCIRIKVLLDNYHGPRRPELDVEVFELVYDATAHIPIHQAWKDLSRAERQLHQRHMDHLEQQYGARVGLAVKQLSQGL